MLHLTIFVTTLIKQFQGVMKLRCLYKNSLVLTSQFHDSEELFFYRSTEKQCWSINLITWQICIYYIWISYYKVIYWLSWLYVHQCNIKGYKNCKILEYTKCLLVYFILLPCINLWYKRNFKLYAKSYNIQKLWRVLFFQIKKEYN